MELPLRNRNRWVANLNGVIFILTIAVLTACGCSDQDKPVADSNQRPANSSQTDAAQPQPESQETKKDDYPQQIADTLYMNGKIYTVNDKQPWVTLEILPAPLFQLAIQCLQ